MSDSLNFPSDLAACHALLREQMGQLTRSASILAEQVATIAAQTTTITTQTATMESQRKQIEELGLEMEKLRKLISHFVNSHRSEKRILSGPDQALLPFDNNEEFKAARAEAQAEAIVQTYTMTRTIRKKKRDESLPRHLRRVEQIILGASTPASRPRSSTPSGICTCRSTASRTSSRGAAGFPAVRPC